MRVTVGKILRVWHDIGRPHSYLINIYEDRHGSIVTDSIISHDIEILNNQYRGQYVYICDPVDVSNNIILGPDGRRTGRLVLNEDGTIRLAQNNHTEVGQRVNIEH